MSRSATPARQNEATRRWKPPKVTPVAELTIGTASMRTLANTCERLRLRTADRRASTTSTPRPPCYALGEKSGLVHMKRPILRSLGASEQLRARRPIKYSVYHHRLLCHGLLCIPSCRHHIQIQNVKGL